jgi:translation initiation factor IF-1
MSQRRDSFLVEGVVQDVLQQGVFRVRLSNGHELLAHLSKELNLNTTKLLPESKILLEIHPYDLSRGRILESL